MHAVLEGVMRMLMKSRFDSKFHAAPYYIGRHVQQIDHILLKHLNFAIGFFLFTNYAIRFLTFSLLASLYPTCVCNTHFDI